MLDEVVFIASTVRYRIVSNVFTGQKFLDIETDFLLVLPNGCNMTSTFFKYRI
jgi:hypothetical protein